MAESRWMTTAEMSEALEIPERTCQRWLGKNHAGLFPSAKKERPSRNSRYLVKRSEVMEARTQISTTQDDI